MTTESRSAAGSSIGALRRSKALRDSLFVAAFFGGVVLINGILAIFLIEFFQSIGWWEVQPASGAEGAAALSDTSDVESPSG